MRLDVFLAAEGLADSRTEAKNFILSGAVSVNGKEVRKPSFEIDENSSVAVDKSLKKYASRGGLKLEAALNAFSVSPEGAMAIDIGASSGGFTECLLTHGAKHVIAVDSGSGQMTEALRLDDRVTVVENYNARYMQPEDFGYVPTLAVMDVSFISATYIMPALIRCIAEGGDFICLIKPQFEVGKAGLGKGGIVKDARLRKNAVDEVMSFASSVGFIPMGLIESPIVGGDGNIEYLAHFKSEEKS